MLCNLGNINQCVIFGFSYVLRGLLNLNQSKRKIPKLTLTRDKTNKEKNPLAIKTLGIIRSHSCLSLTRN